MLKTFFLFSLFFLSTSLLRATEPINHVEATLGKSPDGNVGYVSIPPISEDQFRNQMAVNNAKLSSSIPPNYSNFLNSNLIPSNFNSSSVEKFLKSNYTLQAKSYDPQKYGGDLDLIKKVYTAELFNQALNIGIKNIDSKQQYLVIEGILSKNISFSVKNESDLFALELYSAAISQQTFCTNKKDFNELEFAKAIIEARQIFNSSGAFNDAPELNDKSLLLAESLVAGNVQLFVKVFGTFLTTHSFGNGFYQAILDDANPLHDFYPFQWGSDNSNSYYYGRMLGHVTSLVIGGIETVAGLEIAAGATGIEIVFAPTPASIAVIPTCIAATAFGLAVSVEGADIMLSGMKHILKESSNDVNLNFVKTLDYLNKSGSFSKHIFEDRKMLKLNNEATKNILQFPDEGMVHVVPFDKLKEVKVDGLKSNADFNLTMFKYIKNVSDPKVFNTALFPEDLWESNKEKFNKGAVILLVEPREEFNRNASKTNLKNGIYEWKLKSDIPSSQIKIIGIIE